MPRLSLKTANSARSDTNCTALEHPGRQPTLLPLLFTARDIERSSFGYFSQAKKTGEKVPKTQELVNTRENWMKTRKVRKA